MPPKVGQLPSAEAYDIKMVRRIRSRAEANTRRSRQRKERILRACDELLSCLEGDPDFGERRSDGSEA